MTTIRTDQLDYDLPESLIATRPAQPRDAARMLVVHPTRSDDQVEHRHVRDLPQYLKSGDVIVVNDTSVLPARLRGIREDSGGRVEGLFLDIASNNEASESVWHVMLRSNGRLSRGNRIELLDRDGEPCNVHLELIARTGDGSWRVRATHGPQILHDIGLTPLPPYILRARKLADRQQAHDAATASSELGRSMEGSIDEQDRDWYQTVFASHESRSVAAPTAGLHFTLALLATIKQREVEQIAVELQVGAGTFKPVTVDRLAEHRMHTEQCRVRRAAVERLMAAKARGGRIFAIGTTTTRVLESLPSDLNELTFDSQGEFQTTTDLLIAPPYRFRHVDGLLTNFHLPRSTLLALVAARLGLERTLAVYRQAIDQGYRFYSYGDAMLILPDS